MDLQRGERAALPGCCSACRHRKGKSPQKIEAVLDGCSWEAACIILRCSGLLAKPQYLARDGARMPRVGGKSHLEVA